MTAYPSAIYSGTTVSGTTLVASADHANMHNNVQDEVTGIETTLGTTGGTSVLKNFAAGNFPARVNSSNVLQQRVSGTIDNAILGTPSITNGTIANILVGTSQITGGTLTSVISNQAVLGSPTVTGGTINSAVLGTPTLIGVASNYAYSTVVGTTTTSSSFAEVDGTTLKGTLVTANSNKVRVMFTTSISNNGATPLNVFQIVRNPAGSPGTVCQVTSQTDNTGVTVNAVALSGIDAPSSGTNVYAVRFKTSAGTLSLLSQPDTTTFSIEEIKAG